MKKLFCIVIMLITLCGCGNENRITPILREIEFDASVDCDGEKFAYTAEICDDGSMSAYFTDPTELSGMTIKLEDENITAEYMGLSYEAKLSAFPQGNIVKTVYDVFHNSEKGECFADDGENCRAEGNVSGEKYLFYLAPSGLPLSLEFPDREVKIIFNNVKIKD